LSTLNLVTPEQSQALAAGATVLTPTARLAARLRAEHSLAQSAAGLRAWPTPDIRTLDRFLEDTWRTWLYNAPSQAAPTLLTRHQALSAWEQSIPAGDWPLLDLPGTAANALRAWNLAHAYRLPLNSGAFQAHEDSVAFLHWAHEYEQRCRDERWLDDATLPDFLAVRIKAREIDLPRQAFYTGFDPLAPAVDEFLHDVLHARPLAAPVHAAAPSLQRFPSPAEEARAVALWARATLMRNPSTRLALIVPDLDARRLELEHALRLELSPEPFSTSAPFHIALGAPLAAAPPVCAALAWLALVLDGLPTTESLALLRSPYLAPAPQESVARAELDLKLRRRNRYSITISDIVSFGDGCPALRAAALDCRAQSNALPDRASPHAWAEAFAKLLATARWPSAPDLASPEYQAVQSWTHLLAAYASLDVTLPPLEKGAALARLRRMAHAQPFQVQNEGAPLQVMGPLESAGLDFDALWLTGANESNFPAPANPNPFLPLSLQRDARLPGSSSGQSLAFSTHLLARIGRAAPSITYSYADHSGDEPIRPSPLIAGSWELQPTSLHPHALAPLDRVAESHGPAIPQPKQPGGAYLVKDMSLCAFRAFAACRLGCRELDDPEPGVTPPVHGSVLHKAMEMFWAETQSSSALLDLSPADLSARIERCVDTGLAPLAGHPLQGVERQRLIATIAEWLELEKLRAPFTVLDREHETVAEIGGLHLEVRIDRIDSLADGRRLFLDYKTGRVGRSVWQSDRPNEPQLPLYAVTAAPPPDGLLFAQLRTGEMRITGASSDPPFLNKRDLQQLDADSFPDQLPLWRERLTTLAARYASGDASLDPAPQACKQCPYPALCRIHEASITAGEEDNNEETL
jgi:ATP-dependent helicase/nuclease subunit B